jgi:hypothetical protein
MIRKTLAIIFLLCLAVPAVAGTWTPNNFIYKPSLGARGEVEKQTFDSGLERVDARLGKEIWVGDPGYGTTIAAAVTQIDNNPAILRIPAGAWNITANLAIPTNITLKVERGAVLNIADGITLTVNGGLDTGVYRIFACAGTGKVVLGSAVPEAHPEWWGAKGDNGVTDDLAAFQSCLLAVAAGTKVSLLSRSYRLAGELLWPTTNNLTLEGQGRGLTKIIIDHDEDYGIRVAHSVDGVTLKDLTLQGLSDFSSVPNFLLLMDSGGEAVAAKHVQLINCEFAIARFAACAFTSWTDTYPFTLEDLSFKHCWFHDVSVPPYEEPVSEVVLIHGVAPARKPRF